MPRRFLSSYGFCRFHWLAFDGCTSWIFVASSLRNTEFFERFHLIPRRNDVTNDRRGDDRGHSRCGGACSISHPEGVVVGSDPFSFSAFEVLGVVSRWRRRLCSWGKTDYNIFRCSPFFHDRRLLRGFLLSFSSHGEWHSKGTRTSMGCSFWERRRSCFY